MIRTAVLFVLLGVAFADPLSGQDVCESGGGAIVGRVTTGNGRAIANALVKWGRIDGGYCGVRTDQDGAFRITGLREGTHVLEIDAPLQLESCIAPQVIRVVTGAEQRVVFQRVDAPPHGMYANGIPGLSWALHNYEYWDCLGETAAVLFEVGRSAEPPTRYATPQEVRTRVLAIDEVRTLVRGDHPDEFPVPLCDHYGSGIAVPITIAGAKYEVMSQCNGDGAQIFVQNLSVNRVRVHVGYANVRAFRRLGSDAPLADPAGPLGFQLEWDRVADTVEVIGRW